MIGLGDARSFYLSTAKNALGVVHAKSAAGGACMCMQACILMSLPMPHMQNLACTLEGGHACQFSTMHAFVPDPQWKSPYVVWLCLRRRVHDSLELVGDAVPQDQGDREAQGRQDHLTKPQHPPPIQECQRKQTHYGSPGPCWSRLAARSLTRSSAQWITNALRKPSSRRAMIPS